MKICSSKNCFLVDQKQPLEKFSKRLVSKDGYQPRCKVCESEQKKLFYEQNKEKKIKYQNLYNSEHKEEVKIRKKQYYEKHKEESKVWCKQYREKHKEESKKYQQTHKGRRNQQRNQRKKEDLNFKLEEILRCRLRSALKGNFKSGSAVADLMMSISNFKLYLEERFCSNPETGEMMTWKNYGYYGWHIDHIVPLSAFDLTKREELLKACHYTNLRPMWAKQNMSEHDRGMSIRKKICRKETILF